jgi:threonylcarbamoyladenosine tRNA methylthiotransferase MtaB
MAGRTAFTLRVQTGCDEPCAYCIIPATRGRSRSTALEDLVRDVRRIEAAGFNEITLTGVHIGAYGRDLIPTRSLGQLVGALVDATTHAVFRIGSLEPMDCTRDLIERASAGRLAPAFHLPLQHASDRMLQRMRRPYGCADYDALVRTIRRRLPHASIGSDVIVGFPGETDADADRLVEYLADSPLTGLHVFPYSDRPGTAAAALHPKVHGSAVRARGERVREVGRRLAAAFLESLRGTSHRALTIHDGESAVCANGVRIRLDRPQPRNTWVQVTLSVSSDGAVGHVTGPVEVAS